MAININNSTDINIKNVKTDKVTVDGKKIDPDPKTGIFNCKIEKGKKEE